MQKFLKAFTKVLAFASTVAATYMVAFFVMAKLFQAEHWSFLLAFVPALAVGYAVLWGHER